MTILSDLYPFPEGGLAASVQTANYTVLGSEDVGVDSSGGVFDITLKAAPVAGDVVYVRDVGQACGTNAVGILRNGSTINGVAADESLNVDSGVYMFTYDGSTWKFTPITVGGLNQTQVDARVVVKTSGKNTVYISAASLELKTWTCAARALQAQDANNYNDYYYLAFDGASVEYAFWEWRPPQRWDAGTIRFRVIWKDVTGAVAKDVIFGAGSRSIADQGNQFGTPGGAVELTDSTNSDAKMLLISPWSAAMTISGSPAKGDWVYGYLYRNGSAGGDTLDSIDARVLGMEIEYGVDAPTDD